MPAGLEHSLRSCLHLLLNIHVPLHLSHIVPAKVFSPFSAYLFPSHTVHSPYTCTGGYGQRQTHQNQILFKQLGPWQHWKGKYLCCLMSLTRLGHQQCAAGNSSAKKAAGLCWWDTQHPLVQGSENSRTEQTGTQLQPGISGLCYPGKYLQATASCWGCLS